MKPKDRWKELLGLAFRPDEQPSLFTNGSPVVLLLSDVQPVFDEFLAEIADKKADITALRRENSAIKRAGKGNFDPKRSTPHLFPDLLTVKEDARIHRACEKYGADYDWVVLSARLYSEQNGKKYASWPAAIEVALMHDYQWVRKPTASSLPRGSSDARRDRAGEVARRVLGGGAE